MGCSLTARDLEACQVRNFWRHITNTLWVQDNTTTNTELELWYAEQEMATENHRYWIPQRTGHHKNDSGQPSSYQVDQRKRCRPSRRKKVPNNWKHTSYSKKSIQIIGGDLNAELVLAYGVERTCVGLHTQWRKQKRRLAERLAHDTEFHSTQHDIWKDAWKTNDLQTS